MSLWLAVFFHAILLAINFPAVTAEPQPPPENKPFVVQRHIYKPPPPPPETPPPKPVTRKVPVPDPTPDEVELVPVEEPPPDIDLPMPDIPLAIPDAPPEPPSSGPIHVGGDVQRPVKVHAPPPQYTEIARKVRLHGIVIVQAIIDKQGDVTNVRVLKGLGMGLSEAAAEAIKTWKFKPATLNGKPVEVYYNLTVNFSLSCEDCSGRCGRLTPRAIPGRSSRRRPGAPARGPCGPRHCRRRSGSSDRSGCGPGRAPRSRSKDRSNRP